MFNSRDDLLWNAVSDKDLDNVKYYIRMGANVDMICSDSFVRKEMASAPMGNKKIGKSLLHHAAWIGSLPIFKELVEAGADINKRRYTAWRPNGGVSGRGPTCLHYAVQYNRYDIVKYLIDLGINIDTAGEQGHTALHLAAKFNYPDLVKLLLENGARTGEQFYFRTTGYLIVH